MLTDYEKLLDEVNAATDPASAAQQILNTHMFSVTAFTTTNGAGTLKVQVSNDPTPVNRPGSVDSGSWVDLSGATATLTSAGSGIINVTASPWRWMRVVWTHTGSGGTITAHFNGKGV